MNHKPFNRVVVSVCALIVVLVVEVGCDGLMRFLKSINIEMLTLNYVILWVYALMALVTAAGWLLLAWFVLDREARNVWVGVIFLLVGLAIIVYPALYYTPALCCWLGDFPTVYFVPTSYVYSSGGFVAVLGLVELALRRGNK